MNILKALFFVSCILVMSASSQPTSIAPAGSGTEGDPYQIDSLPNLYWLSLSSDHWDEYFIQNADIDASTTSTWDSNNGFTPIGNSTTKFTGNYNGNGHTIFGLTINRSSTWYLGLFGYVSGATIKNIGITGASIYGTDYAGALAGVCTGSTTISQCFAKGTVISAGSSVGILVGELASGGTMSNCYAVGYDSSSSLSSNNVGGLIGFNYSPAVSYCYASAKVIGSNKGGLFGNSTYNPIKSFYNKDSCSTSSYGGARTTAQMNTSGNFTDSSWDFGGETVNGSSEIWYMDTSNKGYPFLTKFHDNPIVITNAVSGINSSTNSATANAYLACIGRSAATSYGICWNTTGSPTISDSKVDNGTPTNTIAFTASMAGLTANTTYYVRAFALNSSDTIYGNQVTFSIDLFGSGTDDNPYTVYTYYGLKNISNNLSAVYSIMADIDASESQTTDSGFVPLGDSVSSFSGKIHGHGHKVKNLYINRDASDYQGLCGYLTGSIDSFYLTNCSINGRYYIGGIAGKNDNGNINGCLVSGTVQGDSCAGGIAGNNKQGGIYNSACNAVVYGSYCIGGIAGKTWGTIRNCHSSGRVTATMAAGGIAGYNYADGTIDKCYYAGNVSGEMYIGGIVGANYSGTVSKSFSTGTMLGSWGTGGIAGDNNSTISKCYTTGTIKGFFSTPIYAGGIAGTNEGTISNCYSNSYITDSVSSFNSLEIGFFGGIAGMNEGTTEYCYSSGKVRVGKDAMLAGTSFGALASSNTSSGKIRHCYWNKELLSDIACPIDSGTIDTVLGLTTLQMKDSANFTSWSFFKTWNMRKNSTYPGLDSIDNAPFAFFDSLKSGRTVLLSKVLANDEDIETLQKDLVFKVQSTSIGSIDSANNLVFPDAAANGSIDTIVYRVGEIRDSIGDTLWGNFATAIVILDTGSTTTGIVAAGLAKKFGFGILGLKGFMKYELPKSEFVSLKIYGMNGRVVMEPIKSVQNSGFYTVNINRGALAAGSYIAVFKAGEFAKTLTVKIAR
jgi:hypothetical protein